MSYLNKLRERRKTPGAVWHKLRTSIGTGKFDFYIALEGEEDEAFYSRFLEERFPNKRFSPLVCDGKGGVLGLHSAMISAYGSQKNVFFFIDSDHDRFVGEDDYPAQFFSTCGYSVENYIYDKSVVAAGIKKFFLLNKSDGLCEDIEAALENDRLVFESRSKYIMSYAIALRANDQNPKLEKLGIKSLFDFEGHCLKSKNLDCRELLSTVEAEPLPRSEFVRYTRLLKDYDPNVCIRGKLVAQFVLQFCRGLEKRFASTPKLNGKPLKTRVEFSKANIVSLFADFVELPPRLSGFFDNMDVVLSKK